MSFAVIPKIIPIINGKESEYTFDLFDICSISVTFDLSICGL